MSAADAAVRTVAEVDETLRELTARYAGACVVCGAPLAKGTRVLHDKTAKTIRCLAHPDPNEPTPPEAETKSNEPAATSPSEPAADVEPPTTPAPQIELAEVAKPTRCSVCGIPLARGALAVRDDRSWTCVSCGGMSDLVDTGSAGASARAEHLDRRTRRDEQVRARHRHLGGLILAIKPDDAQGAKWGVGAGGEERLGPALTRVAAGVGGYALHDRAIPGSTANLDHIVIVPACVYVVDSKRWAGRIEIRDVGGWFKTDLRVYVDGRDRSTVIVSGQKQAERINTALRAANVDDTVVAQAAMCFVDGEWPLLGTHDHRLGGVHICSPRALHERLTAPGPLTGDECRRLAQILAAAFPAKKTSP